MQGLIVGLPLDSMVSLGVLKDFSRKIVVRPSYNQTNLILAILQS